MNTVAIVLLLLGAFAGGFVSGLAGFGTALMESPITGAEGNREFLLYAFR